MIWRLESEDLLAEIEYSSDLKLRMVVFVTSEQKLDIRFLSNGVGHVAAHVSGPELTFQLLVT